MPEFGADRFINGQRVSFFDRGANALQGRSKPLAATLPDSRFDDDELSLRFYRAIGVYEAAFYYYHGYWKSPAGQDVTSGTAIFPELSVVGASLRGPLAAGIASLEVGSYRSASGAADDPLSRNSEYRILVGYERELATELTGGVQYYLERKRDYGAYLRNLPFDSAKDDRSRHVVSLRLTKLLYQQYLKLSVSNFYSPSDRDGYLRLNVLYKLSDNLKVEAGGNHFYGDRLSTFYSQFQNNSNLYAAVRLEF